MPEALRAPLRQTAAPGLVAVSPAATLRVFVAVPEALVAHGLRALVERSDVAVHEVSDFNALKAALAAEAADVCLADPTLLGGRDAVAELLDAIRELQETCHVVLVGSDLQLDDILAALHRGAMGIVDRADEIDVLAAIRAAADGVLVLSRGPLAVLTAGCGPRPDRAVSDAASRQVDKLTPRELEVLRCIASGMTNAHIAEQLVVAERTVKTHVGAVLFKLDVRDRTQATVTAFAAGVATPGSSSDGD